MPNIRIAEAEKAYLENGTEAVERDYRDLVATFFQSNYKEAIPNSDYLHALYLTDIMFRSTRRYIRVLTGTGESKWLDILKTTLIKTLARIKEKDGFLKAIFVGEGEPPEVIVKLQDRFGEKTVQFITGVASKPVRHLIACDSYMLRLEDIHKPIRPNMRSDVLQAEVYMNNSAKTKTTEEKFDDIWNSLVGQE